MKVYLAALLCLCLFCLNAQDFQTIEVPPGPEDITWVAKDSFAFVACDARRKIDPKTQGKILAFYPDASWILLHDSLPFPFHPHGIAALIKNDSTFLYVINHRSQRLHTVEIFFLQNKSLIHQKTIHHKSIRSPNDLFVFDHEDFLITNEPNARSFLYKLFSLIFRFRTDKVIHYQRGEVSTFCKMAYPNGIIQIKDKIFISSIWKRRIEVYDLKGKYLQGIKLDAAPDNIEKDEQENLWTAAHPNFRKFLKHYKSSKYPSPTTIYKIEHPTEQPVPMIFWKDDGKNYSAGSVAAPYQKMLVLGTVFDPNILLISLP